MKINLKKTLLAAVAIGALLAPISAQAEVKIGFLGGFNGPIESLMPPISNGAKLAIDQIYSQGGTS